MDAHLFRLFWKHAEPVVSGARIGKIQEPFAGLLTMDLFNPGKKRQLCWRYGRQNPFCFLTDNRLAMGKTPGSQIMRIRKYFADHHIASLVIQFCHRKIWLLAGSASAGKSDKTVWLCLDLINGPSLHFLEPDFVPLPDEPAWPGPEQLEEAMENWQNWPVLTPPLRKELASLDKADQAALMEDLKTGDGSLFLQMDDGRMTGASAWPAGKNENEIYEENPGDGSLLDGFSRAGQELILDRLYSRKQEQMASPLRKRMRRLQKLLKKLDDDEKRLKAMLTRAEDARSIAAELWKIDARAHKPELIVESDSSIRKIALNERLSIQENMEKFFHDAKRGRRGLDMLAKRREETEAQLKNIGSESVPENEKKESAPKAADLAFAATRQNLPKNVQALLSKDGYLILCGRDARGNNAVRKLASPHDLWAHVETGPGAHVVIRRPHGGHTVPESTLEEAGVLAASKSWLKDAPTANVMFAEVRHVHSDRRGGPGNVLIDKLLQTRLVRLDQNSHDILDSKA